MKDPTNLRGYGDIANIKQDVKALWDIYGRQGQALLIDILAEQIGSIARTFDLDSTERERLRDKTLEDLREAINERI